MAFRMSATPLRVLHVLEATEGGTRRWLEEVVLGLDPSRVRCACVCSVDRDPSFGESVDRFRAHGGPVWVIPMARAIHPLRDAKAVSAVAGILRSEPFDILHGHSAKGGMIARLAARRVGFHPVVYTPHAFPFLCGGATGWVYRQIEQWALESTDAVLAVSRSEAAEAIALGMDPVRVFTAFNGVRHNAEPLSLAERPMCIGTVSRLRAQKDPDTFLEVCARVHRVLPALRFVLCGNGPLEACLRRKALALGLDGVLEFNPCCEAPSALAGRWRVFVSCSRYEGLSYALLDAMATGCPVVATRVPGTEEIVKDGRTGYLAPPGDADALAAAVLRLIADPARAEAMGKAARAHVLERYPVEGQLERLTAFYQALAANPEGVFHEHRTGRAKSRLCWRDDRCRGAGRT